jgi:phage gp36-like protein
MPFLTDADYTDQIKDTVLATITESTSAIRTACEQKAEAQMRSRLAVRYDVATIFAASGSNRNAEIIMYYVDMVLYHLHSRINPGQVPELRKERYGDALTWLDKMASGDYAADLPLIGDEDEDGVDDRNVVQWGGSTPRNPYF